MNKLDLLKSKIAEMYETAKIIESEVGNPPSAYEALEWVSELLEEITALEGSHTQEDHHQQQHQFQQQVQGQQIQHEPDHE
jgi:hypothetical protein